MAAETQSLDVSLVGRPNAVAIDLHLHSKFASGVSPEMRLPKVAARAMGCGIDVLSTGDCLQPDQLNDIQQHLVPSDNGLFQPSDKLRDHLHKNIPERLHRPLHFVLGTEVSCVPPGVREIEGVHLLVFFPSLEAVFRFVEVAQRHGDLQEGRPVLNLSAQKLLEKVCALGPDCHLATAHSMNPWFSVLGTVGGRPTLEDFFGEATSQVLAAETGLTSTPAMCRRIGTLDPFALFSNSDAHSVENLGREYTILQTKLGYGALFDAVRAGRSSFAVKYPLEHTRYYRNWCSKCKEPDPGQTCPHCGGRLVMGSHDRLALIGTRPEPILTETTPGFVQLLPLIDVLAAEMGISRGNDRVKALRVRLLTHVGTERYIMLEAPEPMLAAESTPEVARAIVKQRSQVPLPPTVAKSAANLSFDF